MMNHYLRLVDQPMRIRFQFRKSTNKIATRLIGAIKGQDVPAETPGRVYVIITMDRLHSDVRKAVIYGPYATGIETLKGVWESRFLSRLSDPLRNQVSTLNRSINAYQNNLEAAHAQLSFHNSQAVSPRVIDGPMIMNAQEKLRLGNIQLVTLRDVYEEFLSWKFSMIEPNRRIRKAEQIAPSTYRTYPKRWVLLQQFLVFLGEPKIPVQNISFRTATELKEWLLKKSSARAHTRPYDIATVSKVIKLLKMLLTYAQSKEYIGANPLATFSIPGGSAANPKPLSREQMQLLETCDLPPVLRHQCDSWLIAAELCLHYADYLELPQMSLIEVNNIQYIQHERAKQAGTSNVQTVNLTPRAIRLLDKYGGPVGLCYASAAYFSKQLKRIARLADLRDENGAIIPLAFGQGRDTGLTRRSVQGANNMAITKLGGWSSPTFANRYVKDAVGIVGGFVQGIRDEDQD